MKMKFLSLLFLSFLALVPYAQASYLTNVEIFDVKKEKVVNAIANSQEIQDEIQRCLKSIKNLSKLFSPIPREGQIMKIPLEPPVLVDNQWMYAWVDEVKLILPTSGTPLLMIFDDQNKVYFFEFGYDPKILLAQIVK